MRRWGSLFLFLGLLLLLSSRLEGQGKVGQPAPDFPPGQFSDGKTYSLKDMRGKIVVLYFFEMKAPEVAASVADRNDLVRSMKDKPIKFLAISPGDTLAAVTAYHQQSQLSMPIFADSLNLMEKRYGVAVSKTTYSQVRVIAPDGTVAGTDMSKKALEALLEKTKPEWKYKGKGYDPLLNNAIELLEWGQHVQAMKIIGPYRKDLNKKLAESANKLFEDMKEEGEAWKKRADEIAGDDPTLAFDLYSKITTVFAGSDLAKSVAEPLKKLSSSKEVAAELAARRAYGQLNTMLSNTTAPQRAFAAKYCRDLAKKFPDTPTARRVEELANEIAPP